MRFKKNERAFNPKYFMDEKLLTEAPTREQINSLTRALKTLYGDNCSMGVTQDGIVLSGNNKKQIIKVVSGAVSDVREQPSMYRPGPTGASDVAYALLQNMEMQERVTGPVVSKIMSMAGEKGSLGKFEKETPLSMDERAELAKLREENKKLKERIEELEKGADSGKSDKKKKTPESSPDKKPYDNLEIDQ